ncbi:unnamed protein product [marine sediment metagenome]|uniref:Uncharacterized protein n=1 Tax=marine sediment metagenome TaxID=412755 RepID=X1JA92_9ZZZZ
MAYHYPPKKPRQLTPCEIQEIEDALETVCEEIELALESRRLEDRASSKQNFTGIRQPSEAKSQSPVKGSRRVKPEAA